MPSYDDLFAGQPTQREEKPLGETAWAARKQVEREGVYVMIDSYMQDMGREGGLFRAYLDVQAWFGLYSVSSATLIAAQCPEVTKLADFDGWKANSVYVRHGADTIAILEPGKEYQRDDSGVNVSYNVRKVFDISQTRAVQRPAPATVRDERLLLKTLMNNAPCRFAIPNELPGGVNVAYHPQERTVYVRQRLDAPTIFRGLAQKLARAHMERDGITCESPDFMAYSVSYMPRKRNGISVEGFSSERLPESYAGVDTKALRAETGIMQDVAEGISVDMNRLFAAQEEAQKNRDDGAK